MKLASLKKARDGELIVVSKDLTLAVKVPDIANTLQQALDNWRKIKPQLESVYAALNQQHKDAPPTKAFLFDEKECASPLPRAYQWADGSAFLNHVELVRKARGAEMPESFKTDPLIYQGGSDDFIGPHDNILLPSDEWGVDFEGEITVITTDVTMNRTPNQCQQHIALVMLVNDVSLRGLIPTELAKGFGFFQSKPASAFSPIAVTPDELGNAWQNNKLHLPLRSYLNGKLFGKPNAGQDMTFDFSQLIAHITKTRNMVAGSIVGSGTVSNRQGTDHGTAIEEGGVGYSCIAETRMIETIRDGSPSTPFMQFGDSIKIEMLDEDDNSIFGAIEQKLLKLENDES